MLKILILKRQLDAKRSELKALEEKDAEFQTREADLETAIGEVEPGNAEQEAAVTAEVDAFEADKTAHETAKQTLSADIEHLETELADLERQAPAAKTPEKREKVRGDVHMETQINIRSLPMGRRAFDALPMERRQAIVAQPEVQEFLSKMRGMKGQNRAVTGADHPCGVPGPDFREYVPVQQTVEPCAGPQCPGRGPADHCRHRAGGCMDGDVRCHQ